MLSTTWIFNSLVSSFNLNYLHMNYNFIVYIIIIVVSFFIAFATIRFKDYSYYTYTMLVPIEGSGGEIIDMQSENLYLGHILLHTKTLLFYLFNLIYIFYIILFIYHTFFESIYSNWNLLVFSIFFKYIFISDFFKVMHLAQHIHIIFFICFSFFSYIIFTYLCNIYNMDAHLKMILIKLSFYLKNKSILFLIFFFFFYSTGINIYDLNVTSILSIEVSNSIQNFNIENNKDLLYDYYILNKIDSTLLLIYFISCYCFVPCFIIAPFFWIARLWRWYLRSNSIYADEEETTFLYHNAYVMELLFIYHMRILVISLINILIGQLFVEFSLELPICEYETIYFYFNFSFVGLLSCFYMTYFIYSIFFNFEWRMDSDGYYTNIEVNERYSRKFLMCFFFAFNIPLVYLIIFFTYVFNNL